MENNTYRGNENESFQCSLFFKRQNEINKYKNSFFLQKSFNGFLHGIQTNTPKVSIEFTALENFSLLKHQAYFQNSSETTHGRTLTHSSTLIAHYCCSLKWAYTLPLASSTLCLCQRYEENNSTPFSLSIHCKAGLTFYSEARCFFLS